MPSVRRPRHAERRRELRHLPRDGEWLHLPPVRTIGAGEAMRPETRSSWYSPRSCFSSPSEATLARLCRGPGPPLCQRHPTLGRTIVDVSVGGGSLCIHSSRGARVLPSLIGVVQPGCISATSRMLLLRMREVMTRLPITWYGGISPYDGLPILTLDFSSRLRQ